MNPFEDCLTAKYNPVYLAVKQEAEMRKLSVEKQTGIVSALVEGNSIASVRRMLSVNKRTVLRLLEDVGT